MLAIFGIALIISMVFWTIENFSKIVAAGFTFPTMTIIAVWVTAITVSLYLHFSRKDDEKGNDEKS